MFRSIRFRLALWYTAAVAATFLLLSLAIYVYVDRTLSASLDQSIDIELRWILAQFAKHAGRATSLEMILEGIDERAAYSPAKEYIEIWDSSSHIVYRSPNLAADDTLAHHIRLPAGSTSLLATSETFRAHKVRVGVRKTQQETVLLAMPTAAITAPLDHLLNILLLISPLVILIGALGGGILAKKSFVKINEVVETARRITADRLYDRIPEYPAPDEIGKVVSTFNDMISRLEVSFREIKQFSEDASHELRTPLSVLRTQLETALERRTPQSELKKIIARCLDETLRMSSIVESLLMITKDGSGQDNLVMDPVDMKRLVRETYDESVILASQKAISVTLVASEEVSVVGDEQRLRQMLLNLIDNAIKYSPEHGRIRISLRREDGKARIDVADSGIGIPQEEIPRIFDRFYRVDRARSREKGGAGLGLSIAKWIAEAHGGSIVVRSRVSEGSEFSVFLPLLAARSDPAHNTPVRPSVF